jgi:hypothetical protein
MRHNCQAFDRSPSIFPPDFLSSSIAITVKGRRHSGDDGTIVPLVGMAG